MQFELKQMNGKMVQIYPESFKRKVIEEYLSGQVCKMDLLRKYGIKTKSGIQRWMKSYGYRILIDPETLLLHPQFICFDKENGYQKFKPGRSSA